jgi:methionine-gamma-lyase
MRNVNDGAASCLDRFWIVSEVPAYEKPSDMHIRMKKHSENAMFIASELEKAGVKVFYPGLPSHPQHELIKSMINPKYGYSGMITIDAKDAETAGNLMICMQEAKVGYFAVSLGFYKTLFSSPGSSTSSEIPKEEQEAMGMTPVLFVFRWDWIMIFRIH